MLHVLNALLLGLLVIGSVLAWSGLPPSIPVHFGLGGSPDRWAETSFRSWFLLPLLGVVLAVGLYLLAAWFRAGPTSSTSRAGPPSCGSRRRRETPCWRWRGNRSMGP